jgi:hypothetical protein
MNEWIQNLKAGDHVIVSNGGYGYVRTTGQVERVTNTLVVLSNGERYRRRDGRRAGSSSWSGAYLREATPEAMQEMLDAQERVKIVHALRDANWNAMTLVESRACAASLPPPVSVKGKL